METTTDRQTDARGFLLVTTAGSLAGWEIGFEYGAFDTIDYRRLFAVFVVSTVVLVATFVADDDSFATSATSRLILGLPLIYVLADVTFLTVSQTLVDVLTIAILLTFPYALYTIARLLDTDYFSLPRTHQLIAVATIIVIALLGLYVGTANDRFLTCDDFAKIGDALPDNCLP